MDGGGWADGRPSAGTRFEVKVERHGVSRLHRGVAYARAIVVGLLTEGELVAALSTSRYRYRVIVTDRLHAKVVHEEDWKGDETGARAASERIQRELDAMDVGAFCAEYGIELSSGG